MIDRNEDPGDETKLAIKGALDREVARRFDGERIATEHARAIERTRAGVRGEWLDERAPEGPFARVPVPLQWVGLAAAIVGAVGGIRSFYRDHVATPPVAVQSSPSAASPGAPAPTGIAPEPTPSPRPAPATPPVASTARTPIRVPEPERAEEPRPRREKQLLRAEASQPPPAEPPTPAMRRDGASAGMVVSGAGAVITGEATGERPVTTPAPAATPMIATGALSRNPDGVRVSSDRLREQGLMAAIRSVPQLQATLVAILGTGGRARQGDFGLRDISGLAEGDGEEAGRGSAAAEPGLQAQEVPPGAPVSAGRRGAYYVRAFLGTTFDLAPESGGCLGTSARAVPLRADEPWGSDAHEEGLRRIFGLRSLVPIDGVFLPEAAEGGPTERRLLVAAAKKFYQIGLVGTPCEGSTCEHALTVRLNRLFPDGRGASSTRGLEVPIGVRNGTMAVLAVPDAFLSDAEPDAGRPGTLLFVAVSPRFFEFAPVPGLEPIPGSAQYHDPAVVIERVEPRYPEEARALGVQGKVVLEATVLRDGRVERVHVVSVPPRGGTLLIEPAANAVRRWRFLPARLRGERVDSIVPVTLAFRLE